MAKKKNQKPVETEGAEALEGADALEGTEGGEEEEGAEDEELSLIAQTEDELTADKKPEKLAEVIPITGKFFSISHSNYPREYQYIEIDIVEGVVVSKRANQPDSKHVAVEFVKNSLLNLDQQGRHDF